MACAESLLPRSQKSKTKCIFGYWQLGVEAGGQKGCLRAKLPFNFQLPPLQSRPTWSECVPLNGETGCVDNVRAVAKLNLVYRMHFSVPS